MGIPLVPKLLRAHLAELAENDSRHDGRGRFEGRVVKGVQFENIRDAGDPVAHIQAVFMKIASTARL